MTEVTAPEKVRVELGDRSYDILVGENLLENAADYIKPVLNSNNVFIITDENVEATPHVETLKRSLDKEGIKSETITLKAGEATKGFDGLEGLIDKLLEHKPDRRTCLIALGGGVVGDITGFAASILLRGVDFIQIPTTLLSMVDSSVGGKTGINTKQGKNLVGSFHQPKLVIADISLLSTLPEREKLSGYAEVVKYGLIDDAEFFAELEKGNADDLMVVKSCVSKARIVAEDEKESGKRALLNLGHTFGHAFEAEMGYDGRLLHGEAVAVGMVLAFKFSAKLGLCDEKDAKKVEEHLKKVGLPTDPKDIDGNFVSEKLLDHMRQDKKVRDGKLVFILAKGIGKSFIKEDVNADDVLSFLAEVLSK